MTTTCFSKYSIRLSAAICLAALSAAAQAPFIPGDLALARVGTGAAALNNSSTAFFIEEYSPLGTFVQTIAIPSSGVSALTVSGSATSEGALNRSPDGRYLTFSGYNTAAGLTGVAGSTSATVPRGVATLDSGGAFTLAATTASQYSANNIRSGTSDGSGNFWAAGGNSGTVYLGNNNPAATVQTTVANTRVIQDIGGNLYFSTASGANLGLHQIAGTPTSGPVTPTFFLNTGAGSSPYDFALNPGLTLAYVADDRASASGGIQRWDFDGVNWNLTYTLGTGVANIGARGLAVDFSGGNPIIYATTAEATANRLIAITDAGGASAATTLATAPVNEIYRGVDFAPVPEPAVGALIAAGLAALCFAARRRS